MFIWAIIATLVSVVTILIFIAYRRQVKNTCRHLAFMQNNKTNLRLRSGLPFEELYELSDNVNGLLDSAENTRCDTAKKEANLKEAITNISHDIRTPLTSLDGYFQLLKDSDTEDEKAQCIEVIQNRIDSLKYMLEELFTYAKLQNEDYKIQLSTINISQSIFSSIVLFYKDFQEKNINVITNFPENDIIINCNSEAVQRVVQNILKNVLDHGSKTVKLSLKENKNSIVFTCSNRLNSSDNIDITQVFSRFYKSDPARTHSSTGLGLAIAKGITERMGGSIDAIIDGGWFSIKLQFVKF